MRFPFPNDFLLKSNGNTQKFDFTSAKKTLFSKMETTWDFSLPHFFCREIQIINVFDSFFINVNLGSYSDSQNLRTKKKTKIKQRKKFCVRAQKNFQTFFLW